MRKAREFVALGSIAIAIAIAVVALILLGATKLGPQLYRWQRSNRAATAQPGRPSAVPPAALIEPAAPNAALSTEADDRADVEPPAPVAIPAPSEPAVPAPRPVRSAVPSVAFDPKGGSPVWGLSLCRQSILTCMRALIYDAGIRDARELEQRCVAQVPRCVTSTPWLDDPAGPGCCPQACIDAHQKDGRTILERKPSEGFFDDSCYPGIEEYMRWHTDR